MRKTIVFFALLALVFSAQKVQDSAADELVQQLDNMEKAIQKEQNEHTELYNIQSNECNIEIVFRQSEIDAAKDSLDRAQRHLGQCQTAKQVSEADLLKAQGHVVSINSILSALAAQRAAENFSYESLLNDELNPAIIAVEGAFDIIDSFENEVINFVELTTHVNKLFKTMIQAKKVNKFGGIAAALLSLKTNDVGVQHSSIVQIRNLFQNLLDDLNKARQTAIKTEHESVDIYVKTVGEYEAVLANLAALIQNVESYIEELNICIQTEETIVISSESKIEHNTDALKHASQLCQSLQTQYDNATNDRNDEAALLRKLKAFIREQEEIFGNYGTDGVNSFDEFKKQYEAERAAKEQQFLQLRLKNAKKHASTMSKAAPQAPAKCTSCKKSFVQKKLGF